MKTEGFGVWGSKLRSLFDRYEASNTVGYNFFIPSGLHPPLT